MNNKTQITKDNNGINQWLCLKKVALKVETILKF